MLNLILDRAILLKFWLLIKFLQLIKFWCIKFQILQNLNSSNKVFLSDKPCKYGINIQHSGDCVKLRGWCDECHGHDINLDLLDIHFTLTWLIAQEFITYSHHESSNHLNSSPQPNMSDLHQMKFAVWVILNPYAVTDHKYFDWVH